MLGGAPTPETIHDFYGSPNRCIASAPGAGRASDSATRAGAAACRRHRERDRRCTRPRSRAWSPCCTSPPADVPVMQLSIQTRARAAHHLASGARSRRSRTRVCRDRLRAHDAQLREWMENLRSETDFLSRPAKLLALSETSSLTPVSPYCRSFRLGRYAYPRARSCGARRLPRPGTARPRAHPTEEHFLPLFVASERPQRTPLRNGCSIPLRAGCCNGRLPVSATSVMSWWRVRKTALIPVYRRRSRNRLGFFGSICCSRHSY